MWLHIELLQHIKIKIKLWGPWVTRHEWECTATVHDIWYKMKFYQMKTNLKKCLNWIPHTETSNLIQTHSADKLPLHIYSMKYKGEECFHIFILLTLQESTGCMYKHCLYLRLSTGFKNLTWWKKHYQLAAVNIHFTFFFY